MKRSTLQYLSLHKPQSYYTFSLTVLRPTSQITVESPFILAANYFKSSHPQQAPVKHKPVIEVLIAEIK